jgi:hypothetical protein
VVSWRVTKCKTAKCKSEDREKRNIRKVAAQPLAFSFENAYFIIKMEGI